MIKLNKSLEPEYLTTHAAQWLSSLNNAIKTYGDYESIPKKEKDSLVAYYRHDKIKVALFPTSYNKCAFCECIPDEGGNFVQVEHFYPKSIYPQYCFSWDNFLPCCGRCNLAKSDLDTVIKPIINPYIDEPSDHLYVSLLKIKSKPSSIPGVNTVIELDLNNSRLITARGYLLSEIENITERISRKIIEFKNSTTMRVKSNRLGELLNLIDDLEDLMHPSHAYSFFCRAIIKSEDEYEQAKLIILAEVEN